MIFTMVLLTGMAIPFLFIKVKSSWPKWIPAAAFFIGAIIIGVKSLLFPAPEMAVLGEILYFMLLGSATVGAFAGGFIIHYLKRRS